MGTRSITSVRSRWEDEDGSLSSWRVEATIYVHWDGYLSGVGQWLYNFLDGRKVVNGKGPDYDQFTDVNGPGRLASAIVHEMVKDGMEPSLETPGDRGQEYHYQIDVTFGSEGGRVYVTVFNGPMTFFGDGGEECTNQIFSGTVEEYGAFLAGQEGA